MYMATWQLNLSPCYAFMRTITRLFALFPLLLTMSAQAYIKAEKVEAVKNKVTDDGYVIVTYAEGWDKYSKKTAKMMMEHSAVKKALGRAVLMTLGVPNVTSKEQWEANRKRFGHLDLSFPNGYPAFIFYNKEGYRIADVCITYDERKKPKDVAERIRQTMEAAKKQRELLKKAEAASGVEKAKLLGEASVIPGLRKPDRVAQRIKEADPSDSSRMYQLVTLNLPHKAIETSKTEDWQATMAEIKSMMTIPLLTVEHKQQLCCICIGLLHRHGGQQHQAELKAMIKQLRDLDPNSILGKSADDAERLWVK